MEEYNSGDVVYPCSRCGVNYYHRDHPAHMDAVHSAIGFASTGTPVKRTQLQKRSMAEDAKPGFSPPSRAGKHRA